MNSESDLIKYLQNDIRESLKIDILDVAKFHSRRKEKGGGHHSVSRDVFCYVDHLGYIRYGGNSSERAVKFIREYFPTNYKPYTELIHAMWRHGTIHNVKPYACKANLPDTSTDIEVHCLSTNHNRKVERNQHLMFYEMEDEPNKVYLVMNICQLGDDLQTAINKLIAEVEKNPRYLSDAASRFASSKEPRDYSDSSSEKRIRQQIRQVWKMKGGLLDKRGNVKEFHPTAPK